ncbi:hypothetical protein SAMN06298214_1190 [Bacteroidales bacterium WCE2004]|nr:hypothetical protein SAMN06298214_1190 [Bacteroidales bacterium WCE2004]
MGARHKEHLNPSTGPANSGFWEAYQTLGEPTWEILEVVDAEDVTTLVDLLNSKETAYIVEANATDPRYGYNKREIATTYSPDSAILQKRIREELQKLEAEASIRFQSVLQKIEAGDQASLTEKEKAFIRESLFQNNIFDNALRETLNPDDFSLRDGGDLFWLEEALDFASFVYKEEREEEICRFVEENADQILREGKEGKIIQQIDKDGNIVREYVTKAEICEAFNIIRIDNITNVLKGKQKSAYGFFWRYKPFNTI